MSVSRFVMVIVSVVLSVCPVAWCADYEIYDPELTIEGNRAEVRFSVGEQVEPDGPEYDTKILYWEGGVNSPPFNSQSVVCQPGTSACYSVGSLLQQNYRIKQLCLYSSGNSAVVVFEKKNEHSPSEE